jgi:hypothetical protein
MEAGADVKVEAGAAVKVEVGAEAQAEAQAKAQAQAQAKAQAKSEAQAEAARVHVYAQLYEVVLPRLAAEGVVLTQCGNRASLLARPGCLASAADLHRHDADVQEEGRKLAARTLFDMDSILSACAIIRQHMRRRKTWDKSESSYGLKHACERARGRYVTNGDFIAAMLLCGYAANFAFDKKRCASHINAVFKATWTD